MIIMPLQVSCALSNKQYTGIWNQKILLLGQKEADRYSEVFTDRYILCTHYSTYCNTKANFQPVYGYSKLLTAKC